MRLGKQAGRERSYTWYSRRKWSMYSNHLDKGLTSCIEHAKGWLGSIQGKENRA